ncbi:cytochrome c oxidase subunit 6b-1 [Daucus carota subsp. sativus]|uniref:cytochrome c oxidase subunit 6b-1 n=1 Tax=Daucus carota subsp. sativus TaxID=79200 RepID=UPI0007B1D3D7|nr:PREDICTED: cytochrome c oxidase subunit 6b-1-like [Daucus carota subsp. sativus]
MANADTEKPATLSEQYHLEKEEKLNAAEEVAVADSATEAVKEVVAAGTEESPAAPKSSEPDNAASGGDNESPDATSGESNEAGDSVTVATPEDSSESPDATSGESNEAGESVTDATTEESSESTEQDNAGDQEVEETPGIKLETAPADFRFPTTNQSRHCFTRYIEYHRCVAAKGEGAPECDKFAKYYRSLCPGEWVDRWNEQRENGTFPGPL